MLGYPFECSLGLAVRTGEECFSSRRHGQAHLITIFVNLSALPFRTTCSPVHAE
jgi:hypothetical protein